MTDTPICLQTVDYESPNGDLKPRVDPVSYRYASPDGDRGTLRGYGVIFTNDVIPSLSLYGIFQKLVRLSINIRPKVDPNDNEYHSKENVTCRNQESAELLEFELMDHIPNIQRKSYED
jgi:hypothetical protein